MPAACPTRLTQVELTWYEKRIENWIRFGDHVEEKILDRHRRISAFEPAPSSRSCAGRPTTSEPSVSRIDIVRAVAARESYQTVPFVRPGGEILLHIDGWPKVERVLQAIDAVEAIGVDPCDTAPDHWRHVHSRLTVGHEPRAYTRAQHDAWLLRRRAQP